MNVDGTADVNPSRTIKRKCEEAMKLYGRRFLRSLTHRCAYRPVSLPIDLSWKRYIHSVRPVAIAGKQHVCSFPRSRFDSTATESKDNDSIKDSFTTDGTARDLIDEWRHVVGSWTEHQLKTAQNTLPNLSPNLAFRLYHRIMKEMDFNCNITPSFYCTSRFYVPLLESWKKAYEAQHFRGGSADDKDRMPDPDEMFQMLQELSKIPSFRYEPVAVSIVLGAAISTHRNPAQTPFLAQDLVVANALPHHRNHPYIVCQLMKTWAVSGRGLQQVSQQIDRLLKTVPKPNLVVYNTAIHYYSRIAEMQRVEELFREMEQRGIQPDGATLNHLAHGYARSGHLRAAYDSLEQLVDMPSTTEDQMIACAVGVMDACRRRVRAARSKRDVGADLEYAERVQSLIRSRADGSARSKWRACEILQD